MKNILLFLIISLITSCTIEQHISFKNDGSGHVAFTLMSMGGDGLDNILPNDSLETIGESLTDVKDTIKDMMEDLGKRLTSITGISNVKVESDSKTGKYTVGYDFVSIGVLNKAQNESVGDAPKMASSFSMEKKKFIFKPFVEKEEISSEEIETNDAMADMFKYDLIFSFEKQVKKVNNKNYTISEDKHSVTFKGNLQDISNGKTAVEVKLK